MPSVPIQTGLLSDVVKNIESMVPDLPGHVDDALKNLVNSAVQIVDPTQPSPPEPAPGGVDAGIPPEKKSDVIRAIDATISAIGVILRFRQFVPDNYEKPLEYLAKALVLVKSWID